MTISTWLSEYYPEYQTGERIQDPVAAHARLFEGLLPENMARHEVHKAGDDVVIIDNADENNNYYLCLLTTPLCLEHFDIDIGCGCCPIKPCADEFSAWREKGNPQPMIERLALISRPHSEILFQDEILF